MTIDKAGMTIDKAGTTIDKAGMGTDGMGNGRFALAANRQTPILVNKLVLTGQQGFMGIHCVMNPLNNIVSASDRHKKLFWKSKPINERLEIS
jgi:hypothetical protein